MNTFSIDTGSNKSIKKIFLEIKCKGSILGFEKLFGNWTTLVVGCTNEFSGENPPPKGDSEEG